MLGVLAAAAAAAAKSLQSCPTLCDPRDGSPPGSPIPGILQTRTLEWVAIAFSNAWKWKVKVKSLSHVWLPVTPWTAGHQAPLSMGFSRPRVLEWVAIAFSVRCSYHEIITIIIKMMGGNLGRRWKCHALSFIILSAPRFLQTSGQLLSLRANPGISHAWNPFNHYWKKFQEEEGNGNPLQCSCLENPRDGGAWWAAVYGVAQSRTRLKRLSSSSSSSSSSNTYSRWRIEWCRRWAS